MANRHLPVLDAPSSLNSDGSRAFVQPADVRGRFHRARHIVFVALMGIYIALPWIHIGGRPAVFLDVEHREFDLFGATFNAQDTALLFFLVSGVGFGLVLLTALAGRVWCGWACPQTVFLDGIYRQIERWIEGPREARIRLSRAPWNLEKTARKLAAHSLYVLVSLALAHVLVSYFVSLPRLYAMVRSSPGAHPEAFVWTFAISAALYANFAHFREQLCLGVCPYGRLQGALTDGDSLVVGYDANRGEPRGKVSQDDRGACIDCNRCVVVCPTGIDIRRGQQLDCIGCTACIDACDEIMDRVGQPRGLIRYDSLHGLEGKPRRIWRPRMLAYIALGVAGAIATGIALRGRTSFEANLLRLPGAPYTLEGEQVRNAFEIHLVNKRGSRATLLVEPMPPAGVQVIAPLREVTLGPLENASAPVFMTVDRAAFRRDFPVPIRVRIQGDRAAPVVLSAPFLGPSN